MKNKKDTSLPKKNILLRSNSPIDLQKEDLFNTKPKAKSIRDFIKSHPDSLLENRMLVLYGKWGSGKTSILQFIDKEVGDDFETVFFEAWHHEKDDNLALSLLDAIYKKVANKEDFKEIFKSLYSVIRGFAKSTKINLGMVSIDNKVLIEEIEKQEMDRSLSLHKQNEQFKDNFKKIEDEILQNTNKNLLVFVDDLDRCEPENVLNLLAAIKLFFTYGQKTIYFCALDKEAVTKAVTLKYSDVIKSDEYLEKVFDISFTIPKTSDAHKILEYYFDKNTYASQLHNNKQVINRLSDFICKVNFTNPRHLKKVLNKYLLVEYFKKNQIEGHDLIPDIFLNQGGNILNIIFVLYFIILYEFYPMKFKEIEDAENKVMNHINAHFQYIRQQGSTTGRILNLTQVESKFKKWIALDKNITFKRIGDPFEDNINSFLNIFTPKTIDTLALYDEDDLDMFKYLKQFNNPEDLILISFANYLLDNSYELQENKCDYKFWNLFEMVKTIL